jgi:hypothetical protein
VEQRVDLVTLEQVSHLLAIADVGLDELVLLPGARRRPQVDVDDLLGLLATRELVGQPAADVSRSACDQVAHDADPIPGWVANVCERSLTSPAFGKSADFRKISRN